MLQLHKLYKTLNYIWVSILAFPLKFPIVGSPSGNPVEGAGGDINIRTLFKNRQIWSKTSDLALEKFGFRSIFHRSGCKRGGLYQFQEDQRTETELHTTIADFSLLKMGAVQEAKHTLYYNKTYLILEFFSTIKAHGKIAYRKLLS